jgi:hypothetical protein
VRWSRWSRGWSQFGMPSHRESIQAFLRCSVQADGAALARLALIRSRVPEPSATKAVGKSRPVSTTLKLTRVLNLGRRTAVQAREPKLP